MILEYRVWDNKEKRFFENIYKASQGELSEMHLNMNGQLGLRSMNSFHHIETMHPGRFFIQWFTGKLDHALKKIFEGDILLSDTGITYLIEWDEKQAGFIAVCIIDGERFESFHYSWFNLNSVNQLNIIGNNCQNINLIE